MILYNNCYKHNKQTKKQVHYDFIFIDMYGNFNVIKVNKDLPYKKDVKNIFIEKEVLNINSLNRFLEDFGLITTTIFISYNFYIYEIILLEDYLKEHKNNNINDINKYTDLL